MREFFFRNGLPHRWIDTDDTKNAGFVADLEREAQGPLQLPVIARVNKVLMQHPTLSAVADRVGIHPTIPDEVFDTVIIGCGPSGLGAAVYAASEGLNTLVLDRVGPGGQAGASSRIENYTGFPSGLSGHELAMRSYLQALKFGADFFRAVRCGEGELSLRRAAPDRDERRLGGEDEDGDRGDGGELPEPEHPRAADAARLGGSTTRRRRWRR